MIEIKPTERGFNRGDFKDLYGAECSIQESSLATQDAIWLGCNSGTHHLGECSARMHLTRGMAADLITLLQNFVDAGSLKVKKEMITENSESILAEKTTVDGLFAIAMALHCVSDSIRDQTNRVTAGNQQIADAQIADAKTMRATLLRMKQGNEI